MLIIFSIVCKSHIKEARGNLSNPFFVKIVRVQKHPRVVDMCRNSVSHTLIIPDHVSIAYKES